MEKRTCDVPDCGEPYRARGLCARHWNAAYRKDQHREVRCVACGKVTTKSGPGVKRRPVCSLRCRYLLTFGRDIAEGRELVGPVPRRRIVATPKLSTSTRVRFTAGWCAWCSQSFVFDMRITGTPPRTCSDTCRRNRERHRSRQLRGQFTITKARRAAIYARDGWVCQLCGEPVEPGLPAAHPWAATLDHIECQSWTLVPDHSERNLRLAHRMCNSVRGAT